jgi:glutathione S-transferase
VRPWFLLLNPAGQVPILVRTPDAAEGADNKDDETDEVVAGSRAIIAWVDANQPGPALTPEKGTPAAAAMEALLALHDAFDPEHCAVAFGDLITRTHVAPARNRHASLRLAKAVKGPVMHPSVRAAARAKSEDLAARAEAWKDYDGLRRDVKASVLALLDAVEAALSGVGSGPFVTGEAYTLADVVLTVFLAHVQRYGELAEEVSARPNTLRYWRDVLQARPSFAAADVWTGARPGKAVETVTGVITAPFRAAGSAIHTHVLVPISSTQTFALLATATVDMHNHMSVAFNEEFRPAFAKGMAGIGHALRVCVFDPVHEHVLQPMAHAGAATGKYVAQTARCARVCVLLL